MSSDNNRRIIVERFAYIHLQDNQGQLEAFRNDIYNVGVDNGIRVDIVSSYIV